MKIRLSIRYKMLIVISIVLFATMVSYLYLATKLFTNDKLAYIYDLNSSLVESLSEQTYSELTVLAKELNMFIREVLQPSLPDKQRYSKAAVLLEGEDDILRIEVFDKRSIENRYDSRYSFFNDNLLAEAGLYKEDLKHLREEHPLPLEALAEKKGYPFLLNSSFPPDDAILTFAIADGTGENSIIVAVDFLYHRLLRIFGQSRLHETYLVDERGIVLAHPDPKKVLGHCDMSKQSLVQEGIESRVDRGVREFEAEDGKIYLGAFARVRMGRLTVFTQIPKEEALRAGQELIKRSSLFAVAILIGAFIASIFFSRFLSAPILRLRKATKEIGKGEFNIDVGIKSQDEISVFFSGHQLQIE